MTALGASSSDAARYQRYADIASAGSSMFDLGLGAASLVKLTRVGDEFSGVAAGSQAEKLNSSVIRSNTVHAPQTIDLNAVNDASGTTLANVGTVAKSSDIVRDIPQGELKYPGIERLPEGTAKVGDDVTNSGLDWESVVPKKGKYKGQSRKEHVRLHNVDNDTKPSHGVFYGDGVDVTNKGWSLAQKLGIEPDADGNLFVPMNKLTGRAGGQATDSGELFYGVHIKLVPGTNKIITSYPGN